MSNYAMFKDLGSDSKNKEMEGFDGVKAGTGTRATGNRSSGIKPKTINTFEKYDQSNSGKPTGVEKKHTVAVKDIDTKINLINSNKFVIIDVWAEWCQPCHMISDNYEALAAKYKNNCLFAKENIDHKIQQPENVVIKGVPSFLFFEDGVHVHTVTGADLTEVETKLLEMINNA